MEQTLDLRSLPLLAGLAARSFGCTVVQDASCSTASVDREKVIRIAPIKDMGTQDEADLVTGKVVHEVIHIAYTDWDVGTNDKPFVQHVANILEDVWGERRQSREHPGAQRKICAALKVMQARGLFGLPKGDETPQALIGGMLVRGLRSQELGQTMLQEGYEAFRQAAVAALGEASVQKIWEIAGEVKTCESSAQAFVLARRIAETLKEDADQSQQQQQQGGSSGDEQGQPQPSTGQQGGPQGGATTPFDAGGQPGPAGQGKGGASSGKPTPEQADAIREALEATGQFGATDLGEAIDGEMEASSIATGGRAAGDVLDPNPGEMPDMPDVTDAIRKRAMPVSSQLGRKLEALLEDLRTSQVILRDRGRRLNCASLAGVPVGHTRVFRSVEEEEGVDTALSILIDISASMSDKLKDGVPAIRAVEDTTWALGDVLEKHDVPFSVSTFGARTTSLKKFEESWRKAGRRHWRGLESSTVTHLAVRTASASLLTQEAERKLLLLITDGIPSDVDKTAVAVREAQRHGCEVAILFIAAKAPAEMDEALKKAGTGIKASRLDSASNIAQHIFAAVRGAF